MNTALTKTEFASLTDCERVIDAGQKTFVEVGQALLKIRESRLYRSEFGTFEEYTESRWGWKASRARQLIDAATTAGNLKSVTSGNTPISERVVRPLVRLDPDQQREAWKKASEKAAKEDRPVTARDVGEMVVEIVPPQERKQRAEPFRMPDRGMSAARGAISLLEQILPGDGERTAAITMVRNWCNKNLPK